jgi:hypothetical protein
LGAEVGAALPGPDRVGLSWPVSGARSPGVDRARILQSKSRIGLVNWHLDASRKIKGARDGRLQAGLATVGNTTDGGG